MNMIMLLLELYKVILISLFNDITIPMTLTSGESISIENKLAQYNEGIIKSTY